MTEQNDLAAADDGDPGGVIGGPSTAPPAKSALDQKINDVFGGAVVRKDLVKAVKGNAIVPSFVLEYLLGQYAASDDEATIQAGIESVRKILADHYVHRNQAELVKSHIREKGRYRVIDKVQVQLNEKDDTYEAEFANLGIKQVIVAPATIKAHPKLLVGGVWCICDIEYQHSDSARVVPWILGSIKPIQLSNFDFDGYVASRRKFTTDEWIDLLIQSIGFNPEMFGRRAKLIQLVRLIPFVERNYNLVELGPKGTGKSHIFSEFSPHGMLISGGEITVAKLFVNNSNGRIGLVGYWDVVAFDEFAGKKKRTDKALVDIMKNYMANKSFSRGVETLGAEASMVFVGNTSHNVPYMLKHSDLFDELPESYHDSAYLDRLHFYIPGWEVDTIRGEMFSEGYGFVVDYIAEVLKSMRDSDFSDRYQQHFTLGSDISTRDRDGIHKTFSGLMKILHPQAEATKDEIEEILRFAVEGRKRVKDQILRIDSTMADVKFGYLDKAGEWRAVTTLEEDEYPTYYHQRRRTDDESGGSTDGEEPKPPAAPTADEPPKPKPLFEGHREFQENQRGVSYENLLLPYLRGAAELNIVDPYIRAPHQGRNLVDLLAVLASAKDPADEISVTLVTKEDKPEYQQQQLLMLKAIQDGAASVGIKFNVQWDESIHDRSIRADNGWKILLGRGLDIFQKGSGSQFDIGSRRQEFRQVVAFGVTYIREKTAQE
ncbi:BREX system Lon protease-like protein BrxL [Mycobacteroides abscessus]|uniref:BREX system Lon protease-like protein BrxL n=1 Tax=Mycobacteroides abscessus TaxID=36809 RepID=UPI000E682BB3|nr:BREX system Lon protease-like protein BrxL [Mycobacteroides abscessus]MBN7498404.1 BREX system Lon protease-like protein BrxL [Mycobacteroides abscessus subsp. abscessus]RIU22810.1 BREX system Lon protease-like protein BrxL [Mycobacteroides abscessus]